MTLSGKPESYWLESTPPTGYPVLDRDITADVAVVGGGIAGLSTAWELAKYGFSARELAGINRGNAWKLFPRVAQESQ